MLLFEYKLRCNCCNFLLKIWLLCSLVACADYFISPTPFMHYRTGLSYMHNRESTNCTVSIFHIGKLYPLCLLCTSHASMSSLHNEHDCESWKTPVAGQNREAMIRGLFCIHWQWPKLSLSGHFLIYHPVEWFHISPCTKMF